MGMIFAPEKVRRPQAEDISEEDDVHWKQQSLWVGFEVSFPLLGSVCLYFLWLHYSQVLAKVKGPVLDLETSSCIYLMTKIINWLTRVFHWE